MLDAAVDGTRTSRCPRGWRPRLRDALRSAHAVSRLLKRSAGSRHDARWRRTKLESGHGHRHPARRLPTTSVACFRSAVSLMPASRSREAQRAACLSAQRVADIAAVVNPASGAAHPPATTHRPRHCCSIPRCTVGDRGERSDGDVTGAAGPFGPRSMWRSWGPDSPGSVWPQLRRRGRESPCSTRRRGGRHGAAMCTRVSPATSRRICIRSRFVRLPIGRRCSREVRDHGAAHRRRRD